MTDDRIPFLKFNQYAVTVEYKSMTPKELAAEIRKLQDSPDLFTSYDWKLTNLMCFNLGTILAALEAYEPWVWTKNLVAEQAEDPGLWFPAMTAPEAYLQQALRQLHLTVELSMKPKPPEEE